MFEEAKKYLVVDGEPTKVVPIKVNSSLLESIQQDNVNDLVFSRKDSIHYIRNGQQQYKLKQETEQIKTEIYKHDPDSLELKFLGRVESKLTMPPGQISSKIKQLTIDSGKKEVGTRMLETGSGSGSVDGRISKKPKITRPKTVLKSQSLESPLFIQLKLKLLNFLCVKPRALDEIVGYMGGKVATVNDILERVANKYGVKYEIKDECWVMVDIGKFEMLIRCEFADGEERMRLVKRAQAAFDRMGADEDAPERQKFTNAGEEAEEKVELKQESLNSAESVPENENIKARIDSTPVATLKQTKEEKVKSDPSDQKTSKKDDITLNSSPKKLNESKKNANSSSSSFLKESPKKGGESKPTTPVSTKKISDLLKRKRDQKEIKSDIELDKIPSHSASVGTAANTLKKQKKLHSTDDDLQSSHSFATDLSANHSTPKKITVSEAFVLDEAEFDRLSLKALKRYSTWLHQRKSELENVLSQQAPALANIDKIYKDRSNADQAQVLQTLQKVVGGDAKTFLKKVCGNIEAYKDVCNCLESFKATVEKKGGKFSII